MVVGPLTNALTSDPPDVRIPRQPSQRFFLLATGATVGAGQTATGTNGFSSKLMRVCYGTDSTMRKTVDSHIE